ncbi:nucleoporin subcomplex protein binding to Pom34-domain-containing protein [Protomyces lactucae-debilis]|uniref:Nucleoporin NUP188 n=1 Tax=Protomyces lactucae-debilis TaxID=2754530 RepID=A0A1Y2EZ23_PROLT|nr:nucleoporin subcomplex protein binding to Pom34-domain-containing protein [Protomyces lactucae-debilis]ORY76366.1 nucleoporin subcomplex protein binding to Pom34-domain-containing protein [Protomyces lactucae-debilis]
MGSLFIKRFAEALETRHLSPALLTRARDALAGQSAEDEELCLHLRAYEPLLDQCLACLEGELDIEATILLDILFFALYSQVPTTSAFVARFIKLMHSTTYLSTAHYRHAKPAYIAQCTSQALLIFLEIIASARNVKLDASTLDSRFFLASPKLLAEIHKTVLDMSTKRIGLTVSMAWGMYLHHYLQRIEDGEQHDPTYQSALDTLFASDSSDSYRYLIELSVEANVYENVVEICEALPTSRYDEKYRVVLLDFFHATVPYIQLSSASASLFGLLVKSRALAQIAWQEASTMRMLDAARQHFPYDHKPLLQILKALSMSGSKTIAYLERFNTFTQTLPTGFQGYTTTGEDGPQTVIQLTEPLVLFAPRTRHGKILLELGTRGLLISSGAKIIVLWQYEYSCLFFLARILHAAAKNRTVLQHRDLIMDVLVVFSHIVASCDDAEAFLQTIAEETQEDLEQTVYEIFEQALISKTDTALTTECAHFFGAVFPVLPESVWAFVGKLPLFGKDGQSGLLMDMVTSAEYAHGDYTMLRAMLKLFNTSITCLVQHALTSDSRLQEAKQQFLLGAVKMASHVFQSYLSWPHADATRQHDLGTDTAKLFSRILQLTYGTHLRLAGRLTGFVATLEPAATMILQTYCTKASRGALSNLEEALQAETPEDFNSAVLNMAGILLQTAPDDNPSALHKSLYARLPQLARLLSTGRQDAILRLLTALIDRAWHAQTPSILAHLGSEKQLLRSALWAMLEDESRMTEASSQLLWGFLVRFMQPEQEGVALYLLTDDKDQPKDRSLLRPIQKHIETVREETWSPKLTSGVLAVLAAAQTWPSIVFNQLKGETQFWTSLQALLKLANADASNQSDEVVTVRNAYRLQCAGYIAQILAAHLNAMESEKRISTTLQLLELIDALPRSVFMVDHYRASLHGNLGRNISQKYPDFKLQALSKATWRRQTYGESFLYDLSLAEPIIKTNAFVREVRIANFNLSLLEAQLQRTHGLHLLLSATIEPRIFDDRHFKLAFAVSQTLLQVRESFDMPMLHGLQVERCVTAGLIIKALAASKMQGDWLQLLNDAAPLAGNLVPSGTQQLNAMQLAQARPILQSCCELVTLLAGAPDQSAQPAQLHRVLHSVFQTSVGVFAPAVLMHPALEDLSLVAALCAAMAILLERYELSRVPFAQELVRSEVLSRAIHVFAATDPEDDVSLQLACGTLSILEQILEVCPAAAELVLAAGLLPALLDARVSMTIRAGDVRFGSQARLHRLWSHHILPLSLSLVRELGVRMRSDLSTLVEAYSPQLESCLGLWQETHTKQQLDAETCDELLLSVLLIEALNRMMVTPNGAFAESKTKLVARLEYLTSHPKTTAAMVRPNTEEAQEQVAGRVKEMKQLIEAL